MATFKERFKELRLEKKLTQQKLAEKFYSNKSSISRYESGDQVPEIDTLQKYADFFGVSVGYLLGKEENRHIELYDMSEVGNNANAPFENIEFFKDLFENNDGSFSKIFPIELKDQDGNIISLEKVWKESNDINKVSLLKALLDNVKVHKESGSIIFHDKLHINKRLIEKIIQKLEAMNYCYISVIDDMLEKIISGEVSLEKLKAALEHNFLK